MTDKRYESGTGYVTDLMRGDVHARCRERIKQLEAENKELKEKLKKTQRYNRFST